MNRINKLSSKDVINYYHSFGSRLGYRLLLGGTKHFGYYKKGDRLWQFKKAMRQMEDYLGKNLDLPKGSVVLDAGCGMGDVAIRMASKFGLRVDGIDLLDFNIKQANKKKERLNLGSRLTFNVGDYSKIKLPANYYNGAYTMETIMHVKDTPGTLDRFYKALKPGGRLVLHEYSYAGKDKMPAKAYKAFTLINELSAMPSLQEFEHGTLANMVKRAGFKNINCRDITQKMAPMAFGFYLLAIIPYYLAKPFGLTDHMTNTSAAVYMKKYRKYFRYNVITATK